MYRILIVDDKLIIRKGLIKMIKWGALNAELVGEAENGKMAVEMIENLKPNIVVTDNRMPIYDGTYVLKAISKIYPEIKTIVISGYSDYEYMQQAVKSGSVDYILKPVDPRELNASLERACKLLEIKKSSNIKFDDEKAVSEYLLGLIRGTGFNEKSFSTDLVFLRNDQTYCCVVIFMGKVGDVTINDIRSALKNITGFAGIFFADDGMEKLAVFTQKDSRDCDIFEAAIYKSICRVLSEKTEIAEKVYVSIGKVCRGPQGVSESYDTALRICDYAILDSVNYPIRYSDTVKRKNFNFAMGEFEERLILNVTSGNTVQVDFLLQRIIDRFLNEKEVAMDSIKLFFSNLCYLLLKLDDSMVDEIQVFTQNLNTPGFLIKFRNINNIKHVILNLYALTTKKYAERHGGRNSMVLKVKEFINLNYAYEIGLEETSILFHVNMSYLSTAFKKETGENINEYITKKRIQSAENILTTENVRLPELAKMVGYHDYTYFQKVFKKITGKTPREFKADNYNKKSAE